MKFINVTDKNFEDIFQVSAKFEQWRYVKHHIFDMVNNYVAIINEGYLPIPFLVYENDNIIGFVQINYFDKKSLYEICKLIVHETEQNKGYGKQILSEIIKWLCIKYGNGTITAKYKMSNYIANKLFLSAKFQKSKLGDEIVATMKINNTVANILTKAIKLFLDYVGRKPLGEAEGIVVSVVEGNNVALRLYEKMGFKIIGRDKYEHIAMSKTV